MDDETLIAYGYVISSSYRERSVKSLNDSNKIPTDLAEDIGIRSNHISKVLRELKECGVAECINEEKRKNRVYRLTPKGEDVAKLID
ncbi:winged helix-turn-helix domain-containing protein [Methanobrevibacter sp.]|uniref:winged helix-turn-helix domain-containing protein n=1 Tax=Methanobrevibacter sp. TaxID=66852 RepID=UPI0025E350FF|nr:winged helix-turn-helix domain-containing protein [Methanobrevibacter sp.]MBQ2666007.1 winged helix-turn-helix transcriptional regulator [Methanobrevibacter sp.]